jgi:Arc/MetJ-type ribon-helix-helix transcriptional regulator
MPKKKPPPKKMKLASFKLAPEDVEHLEKLVARGRKLKLAVNKSKLVRHAIQLLTGDSLYSID